MANINIVDSDGQWLEGIGVYGLTDPTTKVRFDYLQPVKVKPSDWVKLQLAAGVLREVTDPLADSVKTVAKK